MKMKMIQVEYKTHQHAKRQAKEKNIPMKVLIQRLLTDEQIRMSLQKEIEKDK